MKGIICFFLLLSAPALCQAQVPAIYLEVDSAYEAGDYDRVIALEETAVSQLLPRMDSLLANTYFMIGESYYAVGDLERALDQFDKANQMYLRLNMTDTEDYSALLFNLTFTYNQLGLYKEAKEVGGKLLIQDEKHFGKSSEEYIFSVLAFTDVLVQQEDFDEAKQLLRQAIRAVNKENPLYPQLLSKEADIHSIIGHYSKAEKKFLEAMALIEKYDGSESQAYASTSANLALLYTDQGKFPQAEELLLHAKKILKTYDDVRAEDDYITTLNNLALVHLSLNQQELALRELSEVLANDKAVYGDNHPYLALTLSNIGTAYNDMGRYEDAEISLQQALNISATNLGRNSVSYAVDANNLASMYRLSGSPEKAIPLYKESSDVLKEAMGKRDPVYINSIYNLGLSYFSISGDEADAEKLLKKSQKIRKRIFSRYHPKYAESTEKLAYLFWGQNKTKNAEKHFDELFTNYYHQIDTYFPALSEEEKVNFFLKKLKISFEAYNNYVLQHFDQNPELLDKMLDHQLNTKALIMYATNKVRSSIINSSDSILIGQYNTWLDLKEQLSRLFSSQNTGNDNIIDSLSQAAQSLEKELGRKSQAFSETYLSGRVTWKDVQKKLKDGEAVIEIIRSRGFTPQKGGQFNDDIHYVALVYNNQSIHPELIKIPDGLLLENRYINNYRNAIRFKIQDEYSYDKLWRPIGEKLQGVKKIYFSPDGVYNQVSINTLYNPQTQQYLLDEIEIRVLTNSKDLLLTQKEQDDNRKAYLLGYPNYNMNISREDVETTRGGTRGGTTEELTRGLTRGMRAGLLRYMRGEEGITMLPGTKEEVENIGRFYTGTNTSYVTVLSNDATEHFIKNISNPKTLHIATHGFFLPDVETDIRGESSKYVENPLLRSGLILAGAGDFLLTGTPIDSTFQDGILTAYEAMNLNLDDTDLVVLSACETGLGEIRNGEGVYGLQRAFLIAGADNVIMSMWSVDDDATQELMSIFYQEWIKTGNKQDSFRKAQQLLKEKYKDPFYWGAFIMVGI